MTLHTIGYQGRKVAEVRRILDALGATLVDVRASPYSRNAAFNRTALERELGDQYLHRADLGGIMRSARVRSDGPTHEALAWLASESARRPLVIMCMERAPGDCHRHGLITGPHFPDAVHLYNDGVTEWAVTARDLSRNLADECYAIPDVPFWQGSRPAQPWPFHVKLWDSKKSDH